MAFGGWSAAAVSFYEGLEEDNSKAYWQAHKEIYAGVVLAPMEALLAELAPEFGEGKIFRPYRDVRFSADKTPYKTAIGATLDGGGYVQFSADGLAAGCGMYHLIADQLDRYRRAVAQDRTGEQLIAIVAAANERGITVHGTDVLKTAPRGYPKDHPRIDLLRNKGLISWQEWPAQECLDSAGVKDLVADFLRVSEPLKNWLQTHVGASQTPESRRR